MNWKEVDEFSKLLSSVAEAHRRERSNSLFKHNNLLFDAVAVRFSEMSDRELNSRLPSSTEPVANLIKARRHILLRQFAYKDMTIQPVLTLWSQLIDSHYKLSVYIALGFFPKEAKQESSSLRFLGYRFESPESKGAGQHNFFHAQHITNFSRAGDAAPLNDAPSDLAWFPEEQPSFPLSATCLVTFCLNILVTLYGGSIITEIDRNALERHRVASFHNDRLVFPNSCVAQKMMLPNAASQSRRRRDR